MRMRSASAARHIPKVTVTVISEPFSDYEVYLRARILRGDLANGVDRERDAAALQLTLVNDGLLDSGECVLHHLYTCPTVSH